MPTENRVCWEAAHHFWATLPGRWGQPWVILQSFSLHFHCILEWASAKGRYTFLEEGMAHTFAQLGARVLHNSPWCRHGTAETRTALHLITCTIPHHSPPHSFTSQLCTSAAGKQNTSFHHISLPRRGTWTPAETRR